MHYLTCTDMRKLTFNDEIGQGSFAKVYKAFWRGTVVAAKVIPISMSTKTIEKELSVYRYNSASFNLSSFLCIIQKPESPTPA